MPVYEHLCDNGHKFDLYLKLAELENEQICECGEKARRLISATFVQVDFPAYQSPASGKWIGSRSQRREDLKATGCVEYEPSLVQEQKKRHAAEDAALDAKVEEHVEREILAMPTQKREKLAAEVEHLDIAVTRI